MESEDFRTQKLIVPMNLRDSDSSAAACSVAARDSGAFVPVGEIGSDTRQYDCLVTPARVFPLGRFAFSVWCVGRVGDGPKLVSKAPSARLGEGVVSFASDTPHQPIRKNPNVFSVFPNVRFMGSLHFFLKRIGTMNRPAHAGFSLSSSVEERAGVRSRSCPIRVHGSWRAKISEDRN